MMIADRGEGEREADDGLAFRELARIHLHYFREGSERGIHPGRAAAGTASAQILRSYHIRRPHRI